MATAQSSAWSDLRPELLDIVLHRLHSLADRIRFRAVCRPWRHIALAQPLPPLMPWLALGNGDFLIIPDGEIHRMDVPDNACCHGSCDNWLFVVHDNGLCSLMNPFTKASVQLPSLPKVAPHNELLSDAKFHMTVVPPASLNSPSDLLAAVLIRDFRDTLFSFCQPLINSGSFNGCRQGMLISGIAFCHGKLYVANPDFMLYKFDLAVSSGGNRYSSMKKMTLLREELQIWPQDIPLSKEDYHIIRRYLVECDGRLLLVRRRMQIRPFAKCDDLLETACTCWFDVFEADFTVQPCQWRRLNTLGRRALFIGKYCSKSVSSEECEEVKEDSIYFMCDYVKSDQSVNPLRDSGVFNMKTGAMTPLLSRTNAALPRHFGRWCLSWFFPSEAR